MNEKLNSPLPKLTIDVANHRLWQGEKELVLPVKPFAMLSYLAQHQGRLLSKEDILEQIWPDIYVNEGQIKSHVRDIRKALGDDPNEPQYIETVRGRGYRFIGLAVFTDADATPAIAIKLATNTAPTLPNAAAEQATSVEQPQRRHKWLVFALLLPLIIVMVLAAWTLYPRQSAFSGWTTALQTNMALPLPEQPSLVVLPFTVLNDHQTHDYFVDGITESITTVLAKIPNIFIIAPDSAFTYKNKSVPIKQAAEELGVRYVITGSAQRMAKRVRINARLIDALSGRQLWAEAYDRELDNIFAVQDGITQQVLTELQVKLTEGEQVRVWRRQTNNFAAFQRLLRGEQYRLRFNKLDNLRAQQAFTEAVQLDPEFSAAWAKLGWTYLHGLRNGWADDTPAARAHIVELANKALAIDDTDAESLRLLSQLHFDRREHEQGFLLLRKVVDLHPNYPTPIALLGTMLAFADQPEEGIVLIKKAMRLHPYYPAWMLWGLGWNYYMQGDYDQAIAAFEAYRQRNPDDSMIHLELAFAYVQINQMDKAQAAIAKSVKLDPQRTITGYVEHVGKWFIDPTQLKPIIENLRQVGYPE